MNAKFSENYLCMTTNIQGDIQICIGITLMLDDYKIQHLTLEHNVRNSIFC